ncbi:hypothetical protein ACEWPM_018395 [Roseovarius sp. S4756]|uniref:hypothetical protein n=1 Tax=Roseovarius maritimus TaxID=3342637 RepID=UPI00372B6E13
MRTVILHYHLFKNAGTSLDRVLQQNFEGAWLEAEFPLQKGDNSDLVAKWIADNPEAVAFSSHTAMGPIPKISGVRVLPVMFLRDPVARIRSAYLFERKQQSDSWGAKIAKEKDLSGYIRARMERPHDRQVQNFQTWRLAHMRPGSAPELTRAKAALKDLAVLGLVEDFSGSMRRLAALLAPEFPDFYWIALRANKGARPAKTEADTAIDALLEKENADDLKLLDAARALVRSEANAQ